MSNRKDTPASPNQIKYIENLLDTREVTEAVRTAVETMLKDGTTIGEASSLISALKDMPRPAGDMIKPTRTIKAGRYSVDIDGQTRHIKVSTPQRGRWAGYTFLTDLADETAIRGVAKEIVLEHLTTDPTAHLTRYGRETGTCGHCARELTDPESIARGIGPICLAKI